MRRRTATGGSAGSLQMGESFGLGRRGDDMDARPYSARRGKGKRAKSHAAGWKPYRRKAR